MVEGEMGEEKINYPRELWKGKKRLLLVKEDEMENQYVAY